MNIQIAEPKLENALEQFEPEIAVRTRAALAAIFPIGDTLIEGVEPLSKEELSALKATVKENCLMILEARYNNPGTDLCKRMNQVLASAGEAYGDTISNTQIKRSYFLEYAVRWAKGYLYSNNLPSPAEYPELTSAVQVAPRGTCQGVDDFVNKYYFMGMGLLRKVPLLPKSIYSVLESAGYWSTYYANKAIHMTLPDGTSGSMVLRHTFIGDVYTSEGTVWFAGFLTHDDFLKLNFRRIRLGTAIKELTQDSEVTRLTVDAARDSEYDFVLYPNDVPFGEVYHDMRDEIGSCMSSTAGAYRAPFDVHPCDVYSTAHYGQGDNGLVLVQALHRGVPVGRGIMSTGTRSIVRWYGAHAARVLLTNAFGIEQEGDALDGTRLALIKDGAKVAAPYLDGTDLVGLDDNGHLIIGLGDVCFDDTSGYQYLGDTQECCISGIHYPEEDMIYQEQSNTWYHPDNLDDAVECAVTGEYGQHYYAHSVIIDGYDLIVLDGVDLTDYGYTFLNDDIGWTRDTSNYRYDADTDEWYTLCEYSDLLAERAEEEEDEE